MKNHDYPIKENKNLQGINDKTMLDIMSIMQDVEVDLIQVDLKIPKDFSI